MSIHHREVVKREKGRERGKDTLGNTKKGLKLDAKIDC